MRKIKEMLRLHFEVGLSRREIARSLSVSHSTVNDLLGRFRSAGMTWPLPGNVDEAALEAVLYPGNTGKSRRRPEPDWSRVHRELRRKGVTLQLLWLEYKDQHPDGYQYSQFCQRYRLWRGKLDVVMRQVHRAGEKMFVDYAGQTVPVVDPATKRVRQAHIFVAVLGASNYAYAEASWSEDLHSWIGAHCRALEFFGGVPEVIVPEYVPRNIFGLLFPAALCAGGPRQPTDAPLKCPTISVVWHIIILDSGEDAPLQFNGEGVTQCWRGTSSSLRPSIGFALYGSGWRLNATSCGCPNRATPIARCCGAFRFWSGSRSLLSPEVRLRLRTYQLMSRLSSPSGSDGGAPFEVGTPRGRWPRRLVGRLSRCWSWWFPVSRARGARS
jgi:hypothetical protein